MYLTSAHEFEETLGLTELDKELWFSGSTQLERNSYHLPSSTAGQTLVARTLSSVVLGLGEGWMQITYWNNDLDANQDLFYGYRRGHGDSRSLAEASLYRFAPADVSMLFSILSLVLYFRWNARMFDAGQTYFVRVDNDGFLDYATISERFRNAAAEGFPLMGLKRQEPA